MTILLQKLKSAPCFLLETSDDPQSKGLLVILRFILIHGRFVRKNGCHALIHGPNIPGFYAIVDVIGHRSKAQCCKEQLSD